MSRMPASPKPRSWTTCMPAIRIVPRCDALAIGPGCQCEDRFNIVVHIELVKRTDESRAWLRRFRLVGPSADSGMGNVYLNLRLKTGGSEDGVPKEFQQCV